MPEAADTWETQGLQAFDEERFSIGRSSFFMSKRTENKKPVKNEKRREQYGRSDRNIDGRAEL